VESWLARNERLRRSWRSDTHPNGNGNGMGTPLAIAVKMLPMLPMLPTPMAGEGHHDSRSASVRRAHRRQSEGRQLSVEETVVLLSTPTAQLAVNGGSQPPDKRRAGGHQPTLADQAEHDLLPMPTADLNAPSPWKPGVQWWLQGRAARNLEGVVTGNTGDMQPLVDWGKYARAVLRWEHVLGRLVPCPVQPGKTGWRLSTVFVEWMMGLEPGWVTSVPGLSRNDQLRLLGNGVVPQQAMLAFSLLWPRIATEVTQAA